MINFFLLNWQLKKCWYLYMSEVFELIFYDVFVVNRYMWVG